MEVLMRLKTTPALLAMVGLLLVAWSCNVQPGGAGESQAAPPPDPTAKLEPEPGHKTKAPDRATARRRVRPIQPAKVTGPKASKPAPLPKADKTLAIFHSGNIDGEVDPCG
jgi:hypothetical protein